MAFFVSEPLCTLIEHWWHAVQDAVSDLLARHAPAEGEPAPRLVRAEARAIGTALGIFEALVRRMLVIMAAEYGPAPAPAGLPRLLFRLEESAPAPALRQTPAEDPNYHLKALPERSMPRSAATTDGLVPAARILKRLRALAHVFAHGEAYLAAMRARLGALLPPLPAGLPSAFADPALKPEQAANLKTLHDEALKAQVWDSS